MVETWLSQPQSPSWHIVWFLSKVPDCGLESLPRSSSTDSSGDERIDLLVCTIDALGKIHKNPMAPQGIHVWKGLLELKEAFHEVCNVSPNDTRLRPTHDGWVSFQSFYARLVAKGILLYDRPALHAMKQALEDALPREPRMSDAYIRGACEWIIQAGRHLFVRIGCIEMSRAHGLGHWWFGHGAVPRERWESWKKSLKVLRGGLGPDQKNLEDRLLKAGIHMNWVQGQYMYYELDRKGQEYQKFVASIRGQREDVNVWLGGV